jgi:zona occludens toxin (predicted ATPase)
MFIIVVIYFLTKESKVKRNQILTLQGILFLLIILSSFSAITTNTNVFNKANAVKQHSRSDSHNAASTTKIRPSTPTLANNPNAAAPAPAPVVHNTRARAAAGGPTLNDPNLGVERIVDTGLKKYN